MAKTVTRVDGLKELDKRLKDLPLNMAKSAVTSALRSAARPMMKDIKVRARAAKHPHSYALSESVGIKAGHKRLRSPLNYLYVGPLTGNKKAAAMYADFYGRGGSGVFHGHLIEFGTEHSAAEPFMRPSVDQNAGNIPPEFGRILAKRIDARVKKLKAGSKL